jgi:hypothetical protein
MESKLGSLPGFLIEYPYMKTSLANQVQSPFCSNTELSFQTPSRRFKDSSRKKHISLPKPNTRIEKRPKLQPNRVVSASPDKLYLCDQIRGELL